MERKLKGNDAIAILVNPDMEQLRAAAITRLSTLRDGINTTVRAADEVYRAKEADYLAAVGTWKRAASVQERTEAALEVGTLQIDLAAADAERQASRYPHRSIQQTELYRTVLDPDTRDMRRIPYPVYLQRTVTTNAKERSITVGDTA